MFPCINPQNITDSASLEKRHCEIKLAVPPSDSSWWFIGWVVQTHLDRWKCDTILSKYGLPA